MNPAASYEESLPREERRRHGIFYTPADIARDMLSTVVARGEDVSTLRLCDPCCGGGNILVEALKMGFRAENIFGFDSDAAGVEIARERLGTQQNIEVGDFWEVAPHYQEHFDIIVTNPPWGCEIERSRRAELGRRYGAGRSTDSSSLMLLASLMTLRQGGRLSILLPEAFFNIGGFEDVRRKVLGLQLTHLMDYAKPFRGLMTRAQALTLHNAPAKDGQRAVCRWEGSEHIRTTASFLSNPKAIINMWLAQQGAEVVEAIYKKPHLTLSNNARWGMGIVTGNNAKYCHPTPSAGEVGVVRGYNITEEGITPPDTYISSDIKQYQQSAPEEFYRASEKVVYRFIANSLTLALDDEGRYMLNSANGFILNEGFEMSHREVVERLNSPVIKWLFRALFRTHKVLRHDIEQLPLHTMCGGGEYIDFLGIEPTTDGNYKVKA